MISSICGFEISEIEAYAKKLLEENNKKGIRPATTLSGKLEEELRQLESMAENLNQNMKTKGYCRACFDYQELTRDHKCKKCGSTIFNEDIAHNSFGDNTKLTQKNLDDYDNKTEEQKEKIKLKNTKENIKDLQKIKKKLYELSQKKDVQIRQKLDIASYELTCQRMEKAIRKIIPNYFTIQTSNNRYPNPTLDNQLVKNLRKVFNEVNQSRTREIKQKGKTPNISKYIKSQSMPTRKIFNKNIQNKNPFTIYILLDQSGSMSEDTALVSTMINSFYESVKFNKKIKIKVIGFEGSTLNYVEKQTNLDLINYSGGGTPTSEALTYAKQIIQKDNGKKLFILVSDGFPNGITHTNSQCISPEIYIKTLIMDMRNKKGVNSFGILLGSGNFEAYSAIFGENFAQFDQFEKAGDQLTKIFSKYVKEYLQN